MRAFAKLMETLIVTPSRNAKINAMAAYFANTPDPDRGFALAATTGDLRLTNLKPAFIRQLVMERVDPELFMMSYDYVGDLAETIALIWPTKHEVLSNSLPGVGDFIAAVETTPKTQLAEQFGAFMDSATANERWAMIKLATGGLRVGVSARLAKTALAAYSGQNLDEIEKIWHGLTMPYATLFAWLDGTGDKPVIQPGRTFHPMMLACPIDPAQDFGRLSPADYAAEWKWDGIRVQLVFDGTQSRMFSRNGDDISAAFPDIVGTLNGHSVLDGELLVGQDFTPLPFNNLQARLNRKTATKPHLANYPAFVRVYDMLFDGNQDIRDLPLADRRGRLEDWFAKTPNSRLDLSEIMPFEDWDALAKLRDQGVKIHGYEGMMIKQLASTYVAGRPKGPWFKWKRDPRLIDTVMMYAQRGHGRRSSFYSDFTFGIWKDGQIVPVGKAYSGFSDAELMRLDKWVRANTTNRFGPVREVQKDLVVELAFDSAHESPRHKSGVALRFPRVHRVRWDKPADEADTIETVLTLLA
ncbi:cisplatin damage response ATP-dependent DNA ligase [SAR116 cluster bacterium]|nr:cisplatin damage response ATP-dependent DNA ligase [SAR116 cluster bacterium]